MTASVFGILSVFVFFYFPIVTAAKRREWLGRDDIPKDAADYLNKLGSKRKIGRIIYLLDKLERELARQHVKPPFEQIRREGRESCNGPTEFVEAVRNGDVRVIMIKTCGKLKEQSLEGAINALSELLKARVESDKYYIITFSEVFFNDLCGNIKSPLSNEQVTAIVEGLRGLSSNYVLLSLCFWHQFTKATRLEWLPEWKIPAHLMDRKQAGRLLAGVYAKWGKKTAMSMAENLLKGDDIVHIACYNVFIWNGMPQCVYRKSTFCDDVTPLATNCLCDCKCCGFGFSGCRYSCRTAVDNSVLGSWSWRNGLEMSKPKSSLGSSRPIRRRSGQGRSRSASGASSSQGSSAGSMPSVADPGFLYEFGDFQVHECTGADGSFVVPLFGDSGLIVPLICGDVNLLIGELDHRGTEQHRLVERVSKAKLLLVSANDLPLRVGEIKDAVSDEGVGLMVDWKQGGALVSREGLRNLVADQSAYERSGVIMFTYRSDATSLETADCSVAPASD